MIHRPGRAVAIAAAVFCTGLIAVGAAFGAVSGDLDHEFDGDGKLVTNFGGTSAQVLDAAVDSNGKLVVAGAASGDIGVGRFDPDGTPDTSFGGDGFVTVDSGTTTGGERARSVTIQPDGKIVLLGDASIAGSGNQIDLVLARLNADGTLDDSFDGPNPTPGNGVFRVNLGDIENSADVIPASGNLVFTSTTDQGSARTIQVVQLTSSGAFDTSFGGGDGIFGFQWAATTDSFPTGLARQSDDKLVVAGSINGTGPYGVARITTAGALDTTFNSAGTIPGIARPALPAGYIDAELQDVVIDPNGITVAGSVQRNTSPFTYDPALSRVSDSGALVTGFGGNAGYAVLPMDVNENESFSAVSSLDGRLFAGGTAGTTTDKVQLAALFGGTGALDTTFAAPNGFETVDPGVSATAFAAPVVAPPAPNAAVAYLVGQGGTSQIAASAVCLFLPPACPAPGTPVVASVTPASGSDDNNPRVLGTVPGAEPARSIELYTDASCAGMPVGSGPETQFETTGIPTHVSDNTTTTFHALARGVHADSPCSTTSVAYAEVTPPASSGSSSLPPFFGIQLPPATGKRAKALKKCKKIKVKEKRQKCKKRARRLPI